MKRFAGLLFLISIALPIFAQPQTLGEWTAARRLQLAETALDRANIASKQVEAPATAGGGTSLVDQSSAADLVGLALNFAGLQTGDGETAKPQTVTATAYALFAAIHGLDPLDPVNYTRYAKWRRLSFTLGTVENPAPEPAEGEEAQAPGSTRVYGFKYTTNDRNPRKAPSFTELAEKVRNIAFSEAQLTIQIRAYAFRERHLVQTYLDATGNTATSDELTAWLATPLTASGDVDPAANSRADENLDAFTKYYFGGADSLTRFQNALTPEDAAAIDAMVGGTIESFAAASRLAQQVIDEVQNIPQFAFVATLKQPDATSAKPNDTFVTELVFDKGMWTRATFSANAAYEWTEKGGDAQSDILWRFAAQLRYQLSSPLSGRSSFLDFATEGKLKPGNDDIFKAQAKLTLPLGAGVAMPISVTYANREELIEESDVRGQIGFTVDFSKLTELFLRR